jgi:hypothetical protein|tara:strand:- start:10301 stop:10963 length:663 start_codon:yes stop_codon:yes gene_type:complete
MLIPVFLYISQFGNQLSSDHEKWAEMGSFFSGIYAPVLSLLTLTVLVIQRISQQSNDQFHIDMIKINEVNQSAIFYFDKLANELETIDESGQSYADLLITFFGDIDSQEQIVRLFEDNAFKCIEVCEKLLKAHKIWLAVNLSLDSLESQVEDSGYKNSLVNLKIKFEILLNSPLLIALDKLSFSILLTGGKMRHRYHFWGKGCPSSEVTNEFASKILSSK